MKSLALPLLLAPFAAGAVSPDLKVSNGTDPRVPFQFLAEYSYGITDHWQFSFQLPFARDGGAASCRTSRTARA